MKKMHFKNDAEKIAYYEAVIADLEKDVVDLEALIKDLRASVDYQQAHIERLCELVNGAKGHIFGQRADKVPDRQLSFLEPFNEAEFIKDNSENENDNSDMNDIKKKTGEKRGKRKSWLNEVGLSSRDEIYDVSDEMKAKYGDRLHEVGSQSRSVLVHHKEYFEVVHLIQKVYRIKGEHTDDGGDVFIKGELPQLPLGKSYATPSVLAKVITDKFDKGIPFTRQERLCREIGVPLDKQTMANWLIDLNERYFHKAADLIREKIINGHHAIGDETRVQVLHEPDKDPSSESWMWAVMNGRSEPHKMIYFRYSPDRRHYNATEIMGSFIGIFLSDAWGAYDKIPGADNAKDWAHARRKFVDVLKRAPKGTDKKCSFSAKIVAMMDKLFWLDKHLDPEKMTFEEIAKARQEKQKPIVDDIFKTVKGNLPRIPKKTTLHDACEYLLNNEEGLRKYLSDGRVEITSNIIEREMKAFSIPRKNFLFMNTISGAESSANIYSVMRTAVLNDLDPEKYMSYLIEKLPYTDVDDNKELEKIMPWSDSLPEELKSRKK